MSVYKYAGSLISPGTVPNAALANTGVTVTAGAGLSGGGAVALGSTITVSLNLANVNAWTGQQYFVEATLTDAATISWNLSTQQVAKVTLGGNRTMAAPTNLKAGATYRLAVIQDAVGTRLITWNAVFKWPSGIAPTLSVGVNKVDIIKFDCDGTSLFGRWSGDFR